MASEDRHDKLNDAATHSHGEDLRATERIARESADNEPEPDGDAEQP